MAMYINRWLLLGILGLCVLCIGVVAVVLASRQAPGVRAGWVQHRDPLGFQVSSPQDWHVTANGTAITVHNAATKAEVLIIPLLLQQGMPAAQVLRTVPRGLASNFPQGSLGEVKQLRAQPDEAAATMSFQQRDVTGQANLLCVMTGRTGMLYVISGPRERFAEDKPAMLAVLKSFSFTAPTAKADAPGAAPALAYTVWKDPNEGAFSAEVPQGWEATGGLSRRHPIDYRYCLRLTSPDQQIVVLCGDPNLYGYMQPLPRFGFPEGAMYPSGSGLMVQCKTYRSGARFAVEHVKRTLGNGLSQLVINTPRNLPDAAAVMNAGFAQRNLPMSFSTGDVTFGGEYNGTPVRGYCTAGTVIARGLNGAPYSWGVETLYGYRAVAAQEATAQAVLAHLVQTFRIDPEWHQRQQGVTMTTLAIDREKTEAIAKMISGAFAYRNRVQDESSRKWSNAILGQTDVRDPNTGESWKVASGHNYYWRQGDTIAGTATYDPPDIDFTPLDEW